MKKILAVLLSLCPFVPLSARAETGCNDMTAPPARALGLDEVVRIGLCRNPTTAAAYLSAEAARFNKNAQYGNYLPSINIGADASKPFRGNDWGEISTGASVSASWLLFDFGKRLADFNAMESVWRATGFDYAAATQNFVYDTIAAYYGLLSANAEVDASRDLLATAKQARDTADKKFRAGAVARADLLKAETTYASRNVDLQRMEGLAEIARGRLLALLSFPQTSGISIVDAAFVPAPDERRTIENLIADAKLKNPSLQSSAENENAARHRRNSAILRRLPSVSLSAGADYNLDNDFSGNDHDRFSGAIAVRASMPIFAGFSHIYAQRAAQANYERAGELYRASSDNTELNVFSAHQNYLTAI
ncbi:MAG: TolC family protein, partial [Rickettsiales bacterium]|nr:TolC family protein [Rickettsiales bacterium]